MRLRGVCLFLRNPLNLVVWGTRESPKPIGAKPRPIFVETHPACVFPRLPLSPLPPPPLRLSRGPLKMCGFPLNFLKNHPKEGTLKKASKPMVHLSRRQSRRPSSGPPPAGPWAPCAPPPQLVSSVAWSVGGGGHGSRYPVWLGFTVNRPFRGVLLIWRQPVWVQGCTFGYPKIDLNPGVPLLG